MVYIVLGIIVAVILIVIVINFSKKSGTDNNNKNSGWSGFVDRLFMPGYKRAGIRGEEIATSAIESVLRDGDYLFTNVNVEFEGRPAELDNVIVNQFGVYIIEVKNYSGYIIGNEEDFEWQKYKTTDAGNTYEGLVKNPIRQVRRQIDILARHLRSHGINAWIKGYVILLRDNSPVESEYILHCIDDVDRVIHTKDRNYLSPDVIDLIIKQL